MISGLEAHRLATTLGKKPLATGVANQTEEKGGIRPRRTRPRTNPAASSSRSGVAEPDVGTNIPKGNQSSGSHAWLETDHHK
jgi:hypothetical protein